MNRKLKVIAIAMATVCAAGAWSTSVAAAGKFTSDGPVKVTGISALEAFAYSWTQEIQCASKHSLGFVSPPVTTLTDQPSYTLCSGHIGESIVPATVTMNGCDYVLHIGETTGAGDYGLVADIVCPGGNSIEIHAYTNITHSTTICTYKFPAQTGLSSGYVEDRSGEIYLGGRFGGVKASRTGLLCGGNSETNIAEISLNAYVGGENEAGNGTYIGVTD